MQLPSMRGQSKDWSRQTWKYPQPHDCVFGFGLDCDDTAATKNSTIAPIFFQDNALVDYETVKTNPENEDFAVSSDFNVRAGSYIPSCMVSWHAWSPSTEVDVMRFMTMPIYTSMLNRLDAFDKKTGTDVESILQMQHETTDEQAYPLWNNTKIYEGHKTQDYPTNVPGLTTTQQPEGVAFALETFWDAMHYYTNRQMLRQVTGRMKSHYVTGDLSKTVRMSDKIVSGYSRTVPSMCKFQHPYTGCYMLFHVPQAGSFYQYANTGDVTAVEHLSVYGRVRFNEYNPDFNFARA